jgi:hypothetical protein
MNKVSALCAMDRAMMQTFSQRTVEGLAANTLFRLALPPFKSFFEINLEKETAKDRMVILNAAGVCRSGSAPDADYLLTLLQEARTIDTRFLRKAAVFPVDIRIDYRDIENARKQRFELLWQASYRVLGEWEGARSFRDAVQSLYTEAQFRNLLDDILGLYVTETRMLSRSVHIPHLFALARDTLTATITGVMNREARALAGELARKLYRRRGRQAALST